MSLDTVRQEFESFDPLTDSTPPIGALTIADDPAPKKPTKPKPRQIDKRSPLRDVAYETLVYVAERLDEKSELKQHEWRGEVRYIDRKHVADAANALNVKYGEIWKLWATDKDLPTLTDADKANAEREIHTLARLRPLRHLIALAARPHDAEPGEIDEAAAALGVSGVALQLVLADLALMLDLQAQVKELTAKILPALFAHYEQLVNCEPMVNTLVVNWCRDHRNTEGIYPPGVSRWLDKEEES